MKPDIIWFLLDGVRPDRLAVCGGRVEQRTFIDEVLAGGTLFTNAIAAGPYSLIALNALFTSLYGTTNGVNAAYKTTSEDLAPDAVTLTDLLKADGYSTLCYAGSPFEPMEPVPSFDVYRLMPAMDDSVFDDWDAAPRPRFMSLSFQHVHDACCNAPQLMDAAAFEQAVADLSRQFEHFYRRLVGPDVMAMVYSDHGMRIREKADPDWSWEAHPELEPTTGVYVRDETVRTFCGLIQPGTFPQQVIADQVRSIDMVPTLLDCLGLPPIGGQGTSLWPELREGRPIPDRVAYAETGGRWFSPLKPNVRCVRTGGLKFTRHDDHGESMFDVSVDPDEQYDLIGRGHAEEARLRSLLDDILRDIERSPSDHYAAAGVDHAALLAARPPRAAVPELSKGMNAYEAVCHALADADLPAARDHAGALISLADREAARTDDPGEAAAFGILRKAAEEFLASEDLETARERFGQLSKLLILFVADNPSFHDSLVTYACDDVPGYGKWVQKRNDDKIINPYLGRGSSAAARETDFVP